LWLKSSAKDFKLNKITNFNFFKNNFERVNMNNKMYFGVDELKMVLRKAANSKKINVI